MDFPCVPCAIAFSLRCACGKKLWEGWMRSPFTQFAVGFGIGEGVNRRRRIPPAVWAPNNPIILVAPMGTVNPERLCDSTFSGEKWARELINDKTDGSGRHLPLTEGEPRLGMGWRKLLGSPKKSPGDEPDDGLLDCRAAWKRGIPSPIRRPPLCEGRDGPDRLSASRVP